MSLTGLFVQVFQIPVTGRALKYALPRCDWRQVMVGVPAIAISPVFLAGQPMAYQIYEVAVVELSRRNEPKGFYSQARIGNVAAKSLVLRTYAVNRGWLDAPPR